jgi:hypothetical protein
MKICDKTRQRPAMLEIDRSHSPEWQLQIHGIPGYCGERRIIWNRRYQERILVYPVITITRP